MCLERVRGGVCEAHGPWDECQLLTSLDRRKATRHVWRPFEPLVQACPRCLGPVAETRAGDYDCVEHDHGRPSGRSVAKLDPAPPPVVGAAQHPPGAPA